MNRRIAILLLTAAAAVACGGSTEPDPDVTTSPVEWMMDRSDDYLNDAAFRRTELEASLWQPELPYARKRLAAYGLDDRGWDLLPVMESGLEPAETPTTVEEWLALGERVFWELPMRQDPYFSWLLDRPELWEEVGIEADENGDAKGLARYVDPQGRERVAATCGLCHGADGVPGRAKRDLDLGHGRWLFTQAMGIDPGNFASWGPGAIDVTDDGVDDPLAIPNLWGVNHNGYVNSSGAIRRVSPATLAIRFETQYIVGHSLGVRPDRRLTWALAMFVQSLERDVDPRDDSAGADVFERNCASCHRPDNGFSGDLVAAELLTSDPVSAFSPDRGTGFYKVPSLLGVGDGGPYLHDGSAPDLDALLEQGHPHGTALPSNQRQLLIEFLEAL